MRDSIHSHDPILKRAFRNIQRHFGRLQSYYERNPFSRPCDRYLSQLEGCLRSPFIHEATRAAGIDCIPLTTFKLQMNTFCPPGTAGLRRTSSYYLLKNLFPKKVIGPSISGQSVCSSSISNSCIRCPSITVLQVVLLSGAFDPWITPGR